MFSLAATRLNRITCYATKAHLAPLIEAVVRATLALPIAPVELGSLEALLGRVA